MNSTNLLEHQINKFGVITVMDVLLLDIETNKPALFLDTLKVTSLTQEGESKDIRGGIGAPELISYDFARTVTLEIQDALASMGSLEMLWGGKALKGDVEYTAMFEGVTGAGGVIELPADITVLDIEAFDQIVALDVKNGKEYTGFAKSTVATEDTAGTITIGTPVDGETPAAAAGEGVKVKVFLPATVAGSNGAMAIAINSMNVPPTVKLVGQTFFIDQSTGKKIPMQLEIPRFKINIGGGMAMEAEGDAAVFDFNGKAMADENKNFFILKQLGVPGLDRGFDADYVTATVGD